ncbi:hypothetical protein BDD39_003236 [Saccharococcus thermophilus]|uniref:Uncharacterized protein n=1 Tax=Saccharococcus thermophilus TaxID=29396 RepID=A0A846MLY4_9BACL|nr:hypothetical protein [Saccharococcus thermophilus]NIK16587.1 hypothetical protein [Saccharococcus thermophilus]NIK16595.1 hypothetical protein [Saccharococcus thermophilus]
MYFTDDQHKQNYWYLMNLYGLKQGGNVEYEASIYIAAYPEIFKCFGEKISTEFGPLAYLLDEELAQEGNHNIGALTGTTRRLVQFGMSLYNGFPVSLADVSMLGEEEFNVLMQAIAIRSKRQYKP